MAAEAGEGRLPLRLRPPRRDEAEHGRHDTHGPGRALVLFASQRIRRSNRGRRVDDAGWSDTCI
ncbi:MAG: hypothetical protein AVDCRST_MAG76-3792 [uncultured Acidimicrobiales bacterium]|uniref:Uncharacterized protein n=1 Tax=uncultured Acidimicrobiales bacterium TaxID=310071 RepID=A0A6J4JED6_9ACTN|nr:MAG: hypothetical protein AVDCRST_MAG76-3792 [uncultured Acidimicrobiales bacterium]